MSLAGSGLDAEFHLFPKLPTELRLQIWGLACEEERVVPLLPGVGHLGPVTHKHLAVPPILHACAEARSVGLRHYDLSFHPQVYLNRDRDIVMHHICYPRELIKSGLYGLQLDGIDDDDDGPTYIRREDYFKQSAAPSRLAVFLDDISFEPNLTSDSFWDTDPDSRHTRTWSGVNSGNTPHKPRLLPFGVDFLWSLRTHFPAGRADLGELVLLVLPPLTARPNPVAQHLELVGGGVKMQSDAGGQRDLAGPLSEATHFFNQELQLRAAEIGTNRSAEEHWAPPRVSIRFATCTPWPKADGVGPQVDPVDRVARLGMPEARGAVLQEMERFKKPFFEDLGLGPHVMWRQFHHWCGTGRMQSPYDYEATAAPVWPEEILTMPENQKNSPPKGVLDSDEEEEGEGEKKVTKKWYKERIATYRYNGICRWWNPWS